jgi:hypothetical protein
MPFAQRLRVSNRHSAVPSRVHTCRVGTGSLPLTCRLSGLELDKRTPRASPHTPPDAMLLESRIGGRHVQASRLLDRDPRSAPDRERARVPTDRLLAVRQARGTQSQHRSTPRVESAHQRLSAHTSRYGSPRWVSNRQYVSVPRSSELRWPDDELSARLYGVAPCPVAMATTTDADGTRWTLFVDMDWVHVLAESGETLGVPPAEALLPFRCPGWSDEWDESSEGWTFFATIIACRAQGIPWAELRDFSGDSWADAQRHELLNHGWRPEPGDAGHA